MCEGTYYMFGLEVRVSKYFSTGKEFIFPKDRFVEYDKSDIWWLEKYGFGKWKEKLGYIVVKDHPGVIYVNPETYEIFKKQLEKENEQFDTDGIDRTRDYRSRMATCATSVEDSNGKNCCNTNPGISRERFSSGSKCERKNEIEKEIKSCSCKYS